MKLNTDMTAKRDRLIDLIAACTDKDTKRQWIIQMSNMNDIECSESQCDNCLIAKDCIATMECQLCLDHHSYIDEYNCLHCDNYIESEEI
ncbi:MAG: hypothetical protein RR406_00070 [Bacilli bacterium]